MGKKSKNNSINTINPTVSIVTITQLKRFECLKVLRDLIKDQTYKNIIQWVIVEGSKTETEASENAELIKKFIEESDMSLTILYQERFDCKLGELRNRGNRACIGDITVVMDDDDYYPAVRVEHTVEKLMAAGPNINIAGCSAMYIYDYSLEKLYKFQGFGPNHSINSCMAWKKKYLEKNSHDPEKESGEEVSFTKNWTEPMVQLDSEKTLVQSSHSSNTYNKRELLVGGTHKINKSLQEISQPIENFIKESYFSRYKQLFCKESDSPYDIVYFAGGFSIKWKPDDMSLGGSEQAIVNLASTWASLGKKVAVYGEVPEMQFNSVDYFDWKKFPFDHKYKIVILWRMFGLWCGGPFPLKSKNIWLDLHEGVMSKPFVESWFRYGSVITKVFFKSECHRTYFEKATHAKLESTRYAIIPNGVRVDDFKINKDNLQKNPYRFCYCSCYTRGLQEILRYMWPIIYKLEPRAELHVYYGMNHVQHQEFKNVMQQLLSLPGVMDHGRQPMEMIIREKYLSSYHLYITDAEAEIDCISIRESLITGAIPLLSNSGVFKDRDGLHFELGDKSPSSYAQNALRIAGLLKDPKVPFYREHFKQSKTIINWLDTANVWLDQALPSQTTTL